MVSSCSVCVAQRRYDAAFSSQYRQGTVGFAARKEISLKIK